MSALAGKGVLVTRPLDQCAEMVGRLVELGAEALVYPAISIAPPLDSEPLCKALSQLDHFDWIIFTSANGVRACFTQLPERGKAKIAAVGPATAEALSSPPDFTSSEFHSQALADQLRPLDGLKILWPRSEAADLSFGVKLSEARAEVEAPIAYRPVPNKEPVPSGMDIALFCSPSSAHSVLPRMESSPKIGAIGPVTKKAIEALGFSVDFMPTCHTALDLVEEANLYCARMSHVA